ncbi:hypothetical protein LTS10_012925 [Elasticomyces elasticus]|nr:hypothetical protein LTS10_012925 [Elasticomyces elasticus]
MGSVGLPDRQPIKDIRNVFHYTDLQSLRPTRKNDPYAYMHGWGNRHQSELIPGTLPVAQNNPQDVRFGLYTEGITHSSFAAPRARNMSTYMYRVRPSAAHKGFKALSNPRHVENCFLSSNSAVETLFEQAEWAPFPLPKQHEDVDFVDGLHTLGGSGDPNLRQGLAMYVYTMNRSMQQRAFCNGDGDFLLAAQLGAITIQTELGMLHLEPGEICVIQRGIRFSVSLADGAEEARGFVFEVWGSIWELPDLGPLGGQGLANSRDFLFPTAHIDEELHKDWTIVFKTNGRMSSIEQDHSPFDVVAWHGNVVPYKYDLTKFASQNATSIDHTDPSVNTVLTAKSNDPDLPLAEFLWFGPRWDVASNSLRLPYFHRNSASEFLACLYGEGLGRSDEFLPGGGSFEGAHTPHGGSGQVYVDEMRVQENKPRRILEGQMTIMLESSRTLLWTQYALHGCGTIHTKGTDPKVWDTLPDRFSSNPEAQDLLRRSLADRQAEKARLAPYLGANDS